MAVPILFDEILLDPNVFTGAEGGPNVTGWPELANTVVRNPKTGVHKTNVNRFDAVEVLTVNMGLLNPAQQQYLIKMWRGGYGSGVGFRVRVPYDYTATLEVFALGDGEETDFQLYKTYARPGVTDREDVRAIVKPVVQVGKETNGFQLYEANGTTPRVHTAFAIQFGGVNQASGWTVNAKTGVVHFTSAPADGVVISWSGEFDVPMVWVGNTIPFKHDVTSSEAQNVSFREILPVELGIVIT